MTKKFAIEPVQKMGWDKPRFLVMEFHLVAGKVQSMINHWEHLQSSRRMAGQYIKKLAV